MIKLCDSSNACEDAIKVDYFDFGNRLNSPFLKLNHPEERSSHLKAGHYVASISSSLNSVNSNKSYYSFTVGKYCIRKYVNQSIYKL